MPTISGIIVPTGTEATGRRTFLDIIDELARPVDASDETIRALAADSFRAAVRTMNRKGNWPWEVQEEDIAITANNHFSTVTSAIKKPLRMHYLDAAGGNPDQPIDYLPYSVFCEQYTLDIAGQPHTYTIPNLFETGQIRWFPIPSGADNARFTFYRVTPAPRAEAETVEIPDFATEAYMGFAWMEFAMRCPAARSVLSSERARERAYMGFRELTAHVNSPGDRSREAWGY